MKNTNPQIFKSAFKGTITEQDGKRRALQPKNCNLKIKTGKIVACGPLALYQNTPYSRLPVFLKIPPTPVPEFIGNKKHCTYPENRHRQTKK
jgi:hypothetical protein